MRLINENDLVEAILDARRSETETVLKLIRLINAQPCAKLNHGWWVDGETIAGDKFLSGIQYCSVCHKEAYWDSERGQQLFPCCPNCGADMRGEQNGSD